MATMGATNTKRESPTDLQNSFACRPRNEGGLGLHFDPQPDGSVTGTFDCATEYRSYPDRVHGGIVATALDAAMKYCLQHRAVHGITGQLTVRYPAPAELEKPATIRAWVEEAADPLYLMRAEFVQDGQVRARADAKFKGTPLNETPPA